jgi:DNA-binding response OmpR family regulator
MAYKILIVEDENDIATFLSTVLRVNGFEPAVAGDAESGLHIARELRPDLICLDIMMPKESGISMYTRLRQDDDLKDIPVIIISGAGQDGTFDFRYYVTDENIPEPDYYLEKPVSADHYMSIVNEILSKTPTSSGKNENA